MWRSQGAADDHILQSDRAAGLCGGDAFARAGWPKQFAAGKRERNVADEYAAWDELAAAQRENETAACRAVGLVIETRPDHISAEEVIRVRRLGCTKVQIGFQSLNDRMC